jgi:hypothetical protein
METPKETAPPVEQDNPFALDQQQGEGEEWKEGLQPRNEWSVEPTAKGRPVFEFGDWELKPRFEGELPLPDATRGRWQRMQDCARLYIHGREGDGKAVTLADCAREAGVSLTGSCDAEREDGWREFRGHYMAGRLKLARASRGEAGSVGICLPGVAAYELIIEERKRQRNTLETLRNIAQKCLESANLLPPGSKAFLSALSGYTAARKEIEAAVGYDTARDIDALRAKAALDPATPSVSKTSIVPEAELVWPGERP